MPATSPPDRFEPGVRYPAMTILRLASPLAMLALSHLALAGTAVTVEDTCTPEDRVTSNPVKPDVFVSHDKAYAPRDIVIKVLGGSALGRPCAETTTIHPQNDPTGPTVGTSESAADLSDEDIRQRLDSFMRMHATTTGVGQGGAFPSFTCAQGTCTLPTPLQRSAGFLMGGHRAGSYDPLGTFAFLQTPPSTDNTRIRAIPFLVMTAGDNDWLEFSNWGVVFWKARVADFVVNQLYFAVVPDSALRSGPNFWGFYLNTSAPADSQLYVPRVPAPPAPK